ncbi:MAG TPA: alpha/beta fold hydrolase [Acidimicrobiales bacterium]|nr:alpha/beta fold hydrolase [Acidimicrobiales bacterium]
MPAPPTTTFRNEGLVFDVRERGPADGEPVVLLHGYPETKESWDQVAPALADEGFRVLAPDQRGYSPGARPRGRRSYAVDRLVGDVLALVGAAGITGRFHVVGHDWGGVVAWALGGRHPERLASLTSLATPHPSAFATSLFTSSQLLRSWYVLFYQLPVLPELGTSTAIGRRAFERALVRSGLAPDRAARYASVLAAGAAGPAVNWYRGLPFSARSTFAPVPVPTLYVYAGADFALGRRAAELTARHVTGEYRYEVIEGASHWLPEESPAEVGALLLDHLRLHPIVA